MNVEWRIWYKRKRLSKGDAVIEKRDSKRNLREKESGRR